MSSYNNSFQLNPSHPDFGAKPSPQKKQKIQSITGSCPRNLPPGSCPPEAYIGKDPIAKAVGEKNPIHHTQKWNVQESDKVIYINFPRPFRSFWCVGKPMGTASLYFNGENGEGILRRRFGGFSRGFFLPETGKILRRGNHLTCMKPCKLYDMYHINWSRISSIKRSF